MARLTQKQTLLVIAGATTVLCGGAGGGVHWAKGLIEEQKDQIKAKRADIVAGRKKIAKIPDVEEKVIVLRENVKNYITILPKAAELTSFTRKVQDFAAKAGISIDRFVPVRGGNQGGAFQRFSYQYHFRASLWQFMRFMNFFESYERFVSVREYSLTRGEPEQENGDALHSVRMTVETYVYNPKSSGKLTRIVNYETKAKKLRAIIQEKSSLVQPDTYKFPGRDGRRDIFIDPRASADAEQGQATATLAQQRLLIEEYGKQIADLKKKWEYSASSASTMFARIEMQREVKLGMQQIEGKIAEVAEQKTIKNPALNSRWYKEVQLPFKELSRQLNAGDPSALKFLAREEFEKLIDTLKEDLTRGELDSAIAKYNALQGRIEVSRSDPRHELRRKAEGLIIQAKIAKEFSTIDLKISGVLVDDNGMSGVILNGEVFAEGEYIDPNLFVKKVHREEIEFVYKGFTLVKTL